MRLAGHYQNETHCQQADLKKPGFTAGLFLQ
jgi:hypothetical protein